MIGHADTKRMRHGNGDGFAEGALAGVDDRPADDPRFGVLLEQPYAFT